METTLNSTLKDIKEEQPGKCIYVIYFDGYCNNESFKLKKLKGPDGKSVYPDYKTNISNCVDELGNPIQIKEDYLEIIDNDMIDYLNEDDELAKIYVKAYIKDCYLSSSPRSEIMYFLNYGRAVRAFDCIINHYSDFIDIIHDITNEDTKEEAIMDETKEVVKERSETDKKPESNFDWKSILKSDIYLLEFNNFTCSFRVEEYVIESIEDDEIELRKYDMYGGRFKSDTIKPSDIAEVLLANDLFNRAAAATRVTKGIAEANPGKNEFVPLLYYLNKNRAYAEMGKRLNKLNFGKDLTSTMHSLNNTELDKWLDGMSYLLKHMLKYDKDVDRYDLQSYVYRKIGETFDTYKELPSV